MLLFELDIPDGDIPDATAGSLQQGLENVHAVNTKENAARSDPGSCNTHQGSYKLAS